MTIQELTTALVESATRLVPKDTGMTRGDVSPQEKAAFVSGAWKDTFEALQQYGWNLDDASLASKAAAAVRLACAMPLLTPPTTNVRWHENLRAAALEKAALTGMLFIGLS